MESCNPKHVIVMAEYANGGPYQPGRAIKACSGWRQVMGYGCLLLILTIQQSNNFVMDVKMKMTGDSKLMTALHD